VEEYARKASHPIALLVEHGNPRDTLEVSDTQPVLAHLGNRTVTHAKRYLIATSSVDDQIHAECLSKLRTQFLFQYFVAVEKVGWMCRRIASHGETGSWVRRLKSLLAREQVTEEACEVVERRTTILLIPIAHGSIPRDIRTKRLVLGVRGV
jgi:hypothetical protein